MTKRIQVWWYLKATGELYDGWEFDGWSKGFKRKFVSRWQDDALRYEIRYVGVIGQ